ncbi:MAG: hypothetical protein QXR42_05605 [Candidatus Bathyarchaeia archaeon]
MSEAQQIIFELGPILKEALEKHGVKAESKGEVVPPKENRYAKIAEVFLLK